MNGSPSNMNEDDLRDAWRTAELIARYLRKELSPAEDEELNLWKNRSEKNLRLFNELTDERNIEKAKEWFSDLENEKKKSLESLKGKIPFKPPGRFSGAFKWMIAAAVISVIIAGAEIIIKKRSPGNKTAGDEIVKAGDVPPGGTRALLQTSDGSVIDLNTQAEGFMKKEPGAVINKTKDGGIMYENDNQSVAEFPVNTLSTPRGGQFNIILPDGSKAWLNASSSLRYPVAFKNDRTVEATGEVYFEIKKDKRPFIVKIRGAKIEVLGTHFNVNAYRNVTTTLLEGSIKLNDEKLLQPGEQATIDNETRITKLEYPGDVVAWKDGYFRFTHENIKEIMDQLGRWYNIDVTFESNPTQTTFTATARRDQNISTILKDIEKAGHIHFKIEGEKITVLP